MQDAPTLRPPSPIGETQVQITRTAALAALAALLIAGCGASHPKPTPKKTAGTTSALSQKSFNDGYATGKTIAIPNQTVGERQANCGVTKLEDMPTGDIASDWLSGCMLGSMLAN
jgi:hypothetical protein